MAAAGGIRNCSFHCCQARYGNPSGLVAFSPLSCTAHPPRPPLLQVPYAGGSVRVLVEVRDGQHSTFLLTTHPSSRRGPAAAALAAPAECAAMSLAGGDPTYEQLQAVVKVTSDIPPATEDSFAAW